MSFWGCVMKKLVSSVVCASLFAISAFYVRDSAILPSVLAPLFAAALIFGMTDGFSGYTRSHAAFILCSSAYFSLALLIFGNLTFTIAVLLWALAAALLFGRFDTMLYPLVSVGAVCLFYSLTFAASRLIHSGLDGFSGMLAPRAVYFPLLAWALITLLYGLLRMLLLRNRRRRFFTQEAFTQYYHRSAKYLLYFQLLVLFLLMYRLDAAPAVNWVPFATLSGYFTPAGVDFAALLAGPLAAAAMTMPFGFVFASLKRRRLWLLTSVAALLLAGALEGGRFLFQSAFDVDNLIVHIAGFGLGHLVYSLFTPLTRLLSGGRTRNVFAWEQEKKSRPQRPPRPAPRPAAGDDTWWEAYMH